MIIAAPEPLLRLLMCGMLLVAPPAMGQTTTTTPTKPTPTTPTPTKPPPTKPTPAKATPTKQKPTPVVQPHGATRPQKPPPKAPAATLPAPAVPAPVPPPEPTKPTEADTSKGSNSGLPLPRFAALRSDEVNLRAGPGTRYPIEWIYKRRELPVEIQREFEVWRLVQDPDGIKGWVHQATLTGRRSFIVSGGDATLRHDAQDGASAVAILKPGVIGHIRSCLAGSEWCQVQVGDYRGYLKRSQFWGTLPGELVAN
jgi:SH3-like domain-containing protein